MLVHTQFFRKFSLAIATSPIHFTITGKAIIGNNAMVYGQMIHNRTKGALCTPYHELTDCLNRKYRFSKKKKEKVHFLTIQLSPEFDFDHQIPKTDILDHGSA